MLYRGCPVPVLPRRPRYDRTGQGTPSLQRLIPRSLYGHCSEVAQQHAEPDRQMQELREPLEWSNISVAL